jgi:hypothetical protein
VGRETGERLTERNSFNFGVGEGDAQVVEREHAVEGHDEELDLACLLATSSHRVGGQAGRGAVETHQEIARQQQDEADVVRGIRSL